LIEWCSIIVATERNRKYVRLSSNFCRSLAHERRVTQLLPFIGPRDSKFYCLVNDTLVDREEKQVVHRPNLPFSSTYLPPARVSV
jgi:hypothetical protein